MKSIQIATTIFVGASLLLLCGCDEDEQTLKFSHYLHVEDNGMECSECHGDPGTPAFNAISHKTCTDCHDEPESDVVSAETCGYCHLEKTLQLLADDIMDEPAPASQSAFVHTESLSDRCQECHANLMDESLISTPKLSRADRLQIREEAHGSGQACMTCHVDMARDQAPANHDQAWERRHGVLGMQQDASCSVCHSEDSCTECHSVMQPQSHNNMFRTRTHGAMAAWDRTTCMVCHEEDSCASCHANTRPRSHQGRWGAPGMKPTHCIGCHDTSTPGDGCATCHEGGANVMLHAQYWGGAAINHNQPGIENCYRCHWMQTP